MTHTNEQAYSPVSWVQSQDVEIVPHQIQIEVRAEFSYLTPLLQHCPSTSPYNTSFFTHTAKTHFTHKKMNSITPFQGLQKAQICVLLSVTVNDLASLYCISFASLHWAFHI